MFHLKMMSKVYLLLKFIILALGCNVTVTVTVTPALSFIKDVLKIPEIEEKQTRIERGADKFVDLGNGKCVLSQSHYNMYDTPYYDHIDENGNECRCPLCHGGRVLKGNCSCDDPLERRETLCAFVEKNHMMPSYSKCETGIRCKTCEWPWTVRSPCSRFGPDTECQCVDPDYYLVAPDDCRPIPRCDKGYEPTARHHFVDGENCTVMQCQPCPDGYYQPEDNSTNSCRESRKCIVVASTAFSDAKCLNDPENVPSTGTMTDMSPRTESTTAIPSKVETNVTVTDREETDEQVPALEENVTDITTPPMTTTNSTTPGDEKGTILPKCVPLEVFIISVIAAFLLGMAACSIPPSLSKIRKLRKCGNYRLTETDPSKLPDTHREWNQHELLPMYSTALDSKDRVSAPTYL